MVRRFLKFAMITMMVILIIKVNELSSYALTTNIRVGFCAYMPPYQYIDIKNDPKGFHIEILEEIAKNIELKLEYIPFHTTSEAMESLEKGDIDMVLGVARNTVSDYNVLYSSPLSTTNLCLVTNKRIANRYKENQRINENIASEFGIIDYKYLSNIGNGITILTANQKSGIELLLSERTDMLVGVRECVTYYLKKEKKNDDYIIVNNYLSSAEFCVALRQGDQYIQHSIDEVLSDIRTSDFYDSLYNKWFDIYTVDYRYLFRIAIIVIVGVLSTIAIYVIISSKRRTAQIEAENRLRYSIIESSPAAMVLINMNHIIEYMNRNAMNIAGINGYNSGASLKNMRIFREIIEKAGGNIFDNEWESKTGNIDYYKKREKAGNRNTGNKKYRYNIQKMFSYDNQTKALLTVEDITSEDREREAAFEKEKNETLNSIIAGIAHEIKNPLTTINASASMMEKKGDNQKFREAFAAYVPQEIERITRLIDSLLDYARPSASKIEKVNLAEIIESIYELVKITAKNIDIARDIDDKENLYFLGDKDKIKQALLNLMINSVEAIKNKKTEDKKRHYIKIEVSAENDNISIKVSDDGVGMTPKELERCTTPFYTTKPAGTGIGLAFIKQYVEEAGGSLIIDSVKMQYTCVEIQLPAYEERS
mgnify:CR=1 FL=1